MAVMSVPVSSGWFISSTGLQNFSKPSKVCFQVTKGGPKASFLDQAFANSELNWAAAFLKATFISSITLLLCSNEM